MNVENKETEIKPTDSDIKKWSEGNEHLQKLLESCRENNVPSMFCCAGHGKNQPAYITLQMNEKTMRKIYSIIHSISNAQNIAFRFAQKEFVKDPSFTIYMLNKREQNNIMDIISEAMSREEKLESLPHNYQKLVQISYILTKNEIGFDFEYKIGRNRNKLLLENLRFGNSEWIEKTVFKKIGLKIRRDMFGNSQYYRNGINKGTKEQRFLSTIVQNLEQIYDMDIEEYDEEKLNGQDATSSQRQILIGQLSNNGEYLNSGEKLDLNTVIQNNKRTTQLQEEKKGVAK